MWSSDYLLNILHYLEQLSHLRLQEYFREEVADAPQDLPEIDFQTDASPLGQFAAHYDFATEEIIAIGLALVPHIAPGFFDRIIQKYLPSGGEFPEFGGVKDTTYRGMMPTGETLLFILAGMDTSRRLHYLSFFGEEHVLFKHKILLLETSKPGLPNMSGKLLLEKEFVEVFLNGKVSLPKLSIDFPAEHLQTEMNWEDLVLNPSTLEQIKELEAWMLHHPTLLHDWGWQRKLKPGYRVLFYGPPGTGKTLTASLLGKYTQKDVFRVDLSMIVSKYIGETEKNLSSLFDKAENKNWILFFDEADSLFGKRTSVRDAHDKYANQEVSYLLQRIESFPGMVILASNFKGNIDDAFTRRFQAFIHFPFPNAVERLQLWQKAFPPQLQFAEDVDLQHIAERFKISGSNIMNIVQYCCIKSLQQQQNQLSQAVLLAGIERELFKEGKSV